MLVVLYESLTSASNNATITNCNTYDKMGVHLLIPYMQRSRLPGRPHCLFHTSVPCPLFLTSGFIVLTQREEDQFWASASVQSSSSLGRTPPCAIIL